MLDQRFDPAAEEALFSKAGYQTVEPFYSAFTWRGWVARS